MVCPVDSKPNVLVGISFWNHHRRLDCRLLPKPEPQMYTNVGQYVPWIQTIINQQDELRNQIDENSSLKIVICLKTLIICLLMNREVSHY